MGGKKQATSCIGEEEEVEVEAQKETAPGDSNASEPKKKNIKPTERRKKRKGLDKEKHHNDHKHKPDEFPPSLHSSSISRSSPGFHISVFRDLASADTSVRKAAAEISAVELIEVQRAYEDSGGDKIMEEDGGGSVGGREGRWAWALFEIRHSTAHSWSFLI